MRTGSNRHLPFGGSGFLVLLRGLLRQAAPCAPVFAALAVAAVFAAAAADYKGLSAGDGKDARRCSTVTAGKQRHHSAGDGQLARTGFLSGSGKTRIAAGSGKPSAADCQAFLSDEPVPPCGDGNISSRHAKSPSAANGVIVRRLHRKAALAGNEQIAARADDCLLSCGSGCIKIGSAIGDGIFGTVLQHQHHGARAFGKNDGAVLKVHIHAAQHQPHRFAGGSVQHKLGVLQCAAEQIGAALRQHHAGGRGSSRRRIADDGVHIKLQNVIRLLLPPGMVCRHGLCHGFLPLGLLCGFAAACQQQKQEQQRDQTAFHRGVLPSLRGLFYSDHIIPQNKAECKSLCICLQKRICTEKKKTAGRRPGRTQNGGDGAHRSGEAPDPFYCRAARYIRRVSARAAVISCC